jgi:hypothetical protein
LKFLIVEGEIEYEDDLRQFTASASSNNTNIVVFSSPGGNIYRAMELGRLIRSKGLTTFQPRGLECTSACALAFMGGINRYAEPGSIGVHKSSFASGHTMNAEDAVSQVQSLTADVVGYMIEMNVDPALLQLALSYEANDVRYLSRSEMERFRVSTDTAEPPVANTQQIPVPTSKPASQEDKAVAFVDSIISAHTMDERRALEQVQKAYRGKIDYYGKETVLSAVLADKRAYFRRWPERYYRVIPGSISVKCGFATCIVSGVYEWSVRSYARNKQASGTASFQYVLDAQFADDYGFLVQSEFSKVISR